MVISIYLILFIFYTYFKSTFDAVFDTVYDFFDFNKIDFMLKKFRVFFREFEKKSEAICVCLLLKKNHFFEKKLIFK